MVWNYFFLLGFTLVAKQKECDGAETFKGYLANIDECATACRGESQLFAYGTNKHGENRCNGNTRRNRRCRCNCQIPTNNFQCNSQIVNDGYNLYKFQGGIFGLS